MTKIKICGLFREEDISYVNEARPDYAGFVFAKSRRQVTPAQADALRAGLLPGILPVGVFVNADYREIISLYRAGIIAMAQLHGQEDEAYIRRLGARSGGMPVMKAVRVERAEDILAWQDSAADYLLLDHGSGGTGVSFDWKLIPKMEKPYFLAGGIHLGNIEAALALHPYGIDVSTGAEEGGVKSREKIIRLVQTVRAGG